MDAILFSIKRTFHLSSALGRLLLRCVGLTPSRFDMLYVVYRRHGRILQRELRAILGVTAPTVSRMLGSLEKLGLVSRRKPHFLHADKRQRIVELTDHGRSIIQNAVENALGRDAARILVSFFLARRWWDEDAEFPPRDQLDTLLTFARKRLFDTATLRYHWHPDD